MKRFVLPSVLVVLLGTLAESGGEERLVWSDDMIPKSKYWNIDTLNADFGGERLVGTKWKLVEASVRNKQWQRDIIDYSKGNIIFEFRGKNELVITGMPNIFDNIEEGEHIYGYKDQIVCPPAPPPITNNNTPQLSNCCMPMPNLCILNPKREDKKTYFADIKDGKMKIATMNVGWGLSFIRLK